MQGCSKRLLKLANLSEFTARLQLLLQGTDANPYHQDRRQNPVFTDAYTDNILYYGHSLSINEASFPPKSGNKCEQQVGVSENRRKARMPIVEDKRSTRQLYLLHWLVLLGVVNVAVISIVTVVHRCAWRCLLRLDWLRHAKYRCCDGGWLFILKPQKHML